MSSYAEYLSGISDNFETICLVYYENTIPIYMYKSKNTGITVCIAEIDGPIINGYFNIVTETFDNNGLPYAVEHLIFTGSKKYPYDNILKLWAERNLGDTIDSCSAQNGTYFQMSVAGSKGFLTLMPIYLDHIFYPLLEDSVYLTEIHHINDKGNNAGVIYCKLQKQEHTSDYIINKKMFRMLYPGNCGYNSVIEGTTKNLRESTNNEKVKQFHHKFYRPENLTIFITGKIHHYKIFQALLPVEEKIMLNKREDIFERPWQTPIKSLKKSADVQVIFPFEKEEYGEVHVAWRGPSAITQVEKYQGCLLLLDYLIQNDSLLTKEFGESKDDNVFIMWDVRNWSDPYLKIMFKNLPIQQIDLITKQFISKVLRTIYTNGINMETMKSLIHKCMFNLRIDLEEDPHESISEILFTHIAYENTDMIQKNKNNLTRRLNVLRELENWKTKTDKDFLQLLKDYFVDAPMVVVKAKPSFDEYCKLSDEEKHVTNQIKKLGRKRLKGTKLQQSIKEKNKSMPKELLSKMSELNIDSITSHQIERYNTRTTTQHPKFDVTKLPFFTYLDHVITNFFNLQFIMDTSSLNPEYKSYIPLLVEVITKSPVKRGNQLIPYEELKNSLFADIMKFESHIGIKNANDIVHTVSLKLKAELHNYEKSVQWCKEFLYDTKLTAENLRPQIVELVKHNLEVSYQEENLVVMLMDILLYMDGNQEFIYNSLWQQQFLIDVHERLNTDVGQKEVMAKLESVRETLTSPKNMFVYMAVNVEKLTEQFPDVSAPWNKFFSNFMSSEKTKMNITSNLKHLTPSKNVKYNGCILGLDEIDSSFFYQSYPCINNYEHSDLPALQVCLTFLSQEGGPIWKEIQKKKLPDNLILYTTINKGHLNLEFNLTTDVVAAYKKMKKIVKTHLDKTEWNQHLFEKAKSITILNYIDKVKFINDMIKTSLICYCKTLPHDYVYEMARRVCAVTIKDMCRVTAQYIEPLFDPEQCKIAIVCMNDKFAEIKTAFRNMRFTFNVYNNVEELIDYVKNMTTT